MKPEEKAILKKLLHRTWNAIGDDCYGEIHRNGVWAMSLDHAEMHTETPAEKEVLHKFFHNHCMSRSEIKRFREEVFAHKYYEGGR